MGFTDRVPDTPAPSRLVGRTDEVAQAREALARGRSGRGGLLVITGEAGIGKTRLLAEGLAGADEDGVLRGQCVPGGSSLRPISEALLGTWRGRPFPPGDSLRVFRGPLSRLVPGWATDAGTTSSAEDPMVLAEGMLELLQAAYPHPVLVLEDLHWADAATLALLDHLTPGLRATPVTVVATARTDEPGSEELQRLLDHPLVDLLTLARLPGQQTADLVRQRAGAPVPQDAVDLVVEASAGLPLLAEELFAGLVEGRSLVAGAHGWERTDLLVTRVPPSLVGLVTTRLARLAPADVAVVAAAAVSGDAGDWRLLVEATGQDGADVLAALRAAATGHLLTADGPALAWRHALTREAVLASLLAPDVDVARERVAAALAARSDDASAARAADLWAEAGTSVAPPAPGGRWRAATSGPATWRRRTACSPARSHAAARTRSPATGSGCSPCRGRSRPPSTSAPRRSPSSPARRTRGCASSWPRRRSRPRTGHRRWRTSSDPGARTTPGRAWPAVTRCSGPETSTGLVSSRPRSWRSPTPRAEWTRPRSARRWRSSVGATGPRTPPQPARASPEPHRSRPSTGC